MNQHRFDALARTLSGTPSRRRLLRGLAAGGLGWGLGAARLAESGATKSKGLCRRNGSKCRGPGKNCKKQYCLNAPFTVTAAWTVEADHATFLFVPPAGATTGSGLYIDYACNESGDACEEAYPFACVDKDESDSGGEVTTFYRCLAGTYEYWVELDAAADAGEVVVTLRDQGGRVVRQWENPAVPAGKELGWHVFDLRGAAGAVASIDELIDGDLPEGAHNPATDVCP